MTSSSRSKNSEQSAKESLYYNILQCFHTSDSIKVSDLFLLKKSLAEELQNIDGQDLLDTFNEIDIDQDGIISKVQFATDLCRLVYPSDMSPIPASTSTSSPSPTPITLESKQIEITEEAIADQFREENEKLKKFKFEKAMPAIHKIQDMTNDVSVYKLECEEMRNELERLKKELNDKFTSNTATVDKKKIEILKELKLYKNLQNVTNQSSSYSTVNQGLKDELIQYIYEHFSKLQLLKEQNNALEQKNIEIHESEMDHKLLQKRLKKMQKKHANSVLILKHTFYELQRESRMTNDGIRIEGGKKNINSIADETNKWQIKNAQLKRNLQLLENKLYQQQDVYDKYVAEHASNSSGGQLCGNCLQQ